METFAEANDLYAAFQSWDYAETILDVHPSGLGKVQATHEYPLLFEC